MGGCGRNFCFIALRSRPLGGAEAGTVRVGASAHSIAALGVYLYIKSEEKYQNTINNGS